MKKKMSFAELNNEVLFNKNNKKIIWQPRILAWYWDKMYAKEPLPAPFTGMTLPQIHREINASARIYEYGLAYKISEHPKVHRTERMLNETDKEIIIETPVGKQVAIERTSPNNGYVIHVKWEVSTKEELKVATWREENTTWEWNQEGFDKIADEWGDLGAPCMIIPRVNVQSLYLDRMGALDGIYAIYDWKDAVEAYFRALDRRDEMIIKVVNKSPIKIVNFGDNVHCGTLPPDIFEKYVLPAYQKRCDMLHSAGKFVYTHWDGDTGGLLPYAHDTELDGIEAITPKPQGDVTLEQIKEGLGDDIFLIDGIPAVYFDHTYSESDLIECTHRLIELFAPKLVLGISDEISSHGDIERCRIVGKIVEEYNSQFD